MSKGKLLKEFVDAYVWDGRSQKKYAAPQNLWEEFLYALNYDRGTVVTKKSDGSSIIPSDITSVPGVSHKMHLYTTSVHATSRSSSSTVMMKGSLS